MTAPAPTAQTWSVNTLAARAIALNAKDVDDARLLLDMCGLVDGPRGRAILPDDKRLIPSSLLGSEGGMQASAPSKRGNRLDVDLEGPPPAMTSPAGLRERVTVDPPAPRPAAVSRPPGQRKRKPIDHGTYNGYQAHCRRKEPIDQDDTCGCRAAGSAYFKARAAAKKPARPPLPTPAALPAKRTAPVLPPIDHGATAGYRQHHERGALPACDPCTDAFNAEQVAASAVSLDVWFSAAQLSSSTRVRRAGRAASTALLQLQVAMDDLARAERAAAVRTDREAQ